MFFQMWKPTYVQHKTNAKRLYVFFPNFPTTHLRAFFDGFFFCFPEEKSPRIPISFLFIWNKTSLRSVNPVTHYSNI